MTDLYRDPDAAIDARVADLLERMTLEEKVAQLGAVWLTSLVVDERFDPDRAAEALADGIGQDPEGEEVCLIVEDEGLLRGDPLPVHDLVADRGDACGCWAF